MTLTNPTLFDSNNKHNQTGTQSPIHIDNFDNNPYPFKTIIPNLYLKYQ